MNIKNGLQIAALTAGISTLAACATTGNYRTTNQTPTLPEVGVSDTGSHLESVACADYIGDFSLTKGEAETRSLTAVSEYLGLEGPTSMSCRFSEYSYFPDFANPETICVKATVNYDLGK
jgi:hypothetical protein